MVDGFQSVTMSFYWELMQSPYKEHAPDPVYTGDVYFEGRTVGDVG